ncbi:ABC-2 type transport system ATP-binding protein [Evansella caseinilytica]|uniref:ABC-2 type transport system ATP-binding protein n=1 Tax=Evansella caseinilytica TaxID=1503961 RepID=A0A1H3QU96_9BACI|nr:ABC transporter ATP-binding protein [Evansella caseinilytica]SDZ16631.1 ABC-2 type transport system ATP-binding protein [Evansella caseinilytica]
MRVKHLSKKIHQKEILSDIDFEVKSGSIVGIIGRNGAGKTTLLRTMTGILNPTKGDVLLEEESIFKNPKLKEYIIFVPDSSEALKSYSTAEILTIYKSIYPRFDEKYFHELMERFSLTSVDKIEKYSKGMKALFSLVIAFSTRAKYVILDEPTDGLDVIAKKQILKILVEEVAVHDVSIIISSHRLDELEFMANDIVLIRNGKVDGHYELDTMKGLYKKAQVVFQEYMPEVFKNHVTVLNQTGRVYTVIIDMNDKKMEELLKQHQPLLYEELPISLEDVFVAKLGGDEFVS